MDFGALPPEINSARMYSGPGSAPMLAAAAVWDGLAAELRTTAASYQSVIDGLSGEGWRGPASAAMTAAVAPYVAWMSVTGGQAEQAATQAMAAAGAFESAFAMTVPPPAIAANRTLLASLVATNFLGQNTPAIAAAEAAYGEMWAQDAAAMYGYAMASAAATRVTQFGQPQQIANPGGLVNQAAAAVQSTLTSASANAQTALSQLMATVPNMLQGLMSPASSGLAPGSSTAANGMAGMLNFLDGNSGSAMGTFMNSTLMNGFFSAGYISPALISPAVTSALGDIGFLTLVQGGPTALNPAILMGTHAPAAAASATPALPSLGGSAVSAGVGRGTLVGSLSVPQSWAPTSAVTSPPTTASLVSSWTAAPGAGAGETSGMPGMPGMPMTGSSGRGFGFSAPRYGFRPTVMAHPPAAG